MLELAPLAGWVNNAAVFEDVDLAEDPAGVLRVVDANLAPAVVGSAVAARHFRRHDRPGAIVNVSSHQARRAVRGALAYATAKAALEGLTRALAVDEGPRGIRVNAVALGSITTERYERHLDGLDAAGRSAVETEMARLHPLAGSAAPTRWQTWSRGCSERVPGTSLVRSFRSTAAALPGGGTRRRGDRVRRRLSLLVTAYAAIALVVIGVGWLITHPFAGPVDGVDHPVARWFAGERTGDLNQVAEIGTLFGETTVGLAVAAVVGVVCGVWERSLRGPVVVALADFGHGGIYWAATHADPRERPPVEILDQGLVPTHSFPSGHVGTAVVVYGAACLLLALRLRSAPVRRVAVAVLVAVPLFVALSRLYQGAHNLTDVATSLVYGTAWLLVLVALLRKPTGRATRDTIGSWSPRPASTEPATARPSST